MANAGLPSGCLFHGSLGHFGPLQVLRDGIGLLWTGCGLPVNNVD